MKLFKKIITIAIITLLLTVIASTFIANKTLGANKGSNIIVGVKPGPEESEYLMELNKTYDLSKDKYVYLYQYGNAQYATQYHTNQKNALNQHNVWCIEHGAELVLGKWKVGQEYTVTDPMLAYILANGPSTVETDYLHKWQRLLWAYLKDNTIDYGKEGIDGLTDKKRILRINATSNIIVKKEEYNADEYKKAKAYAESVKNTQISISEIQIDYNNSKAIFNIQEGIDASKLKVYLNDEITTEYNIESNNKFVVDISNIDSSILKITVKQNIQEYSAKYRILYEDTNINNSSQNLQRILVTTETGEGTKTIEDSKEVELRTEVSLQKYITEVNGNPLTNDNTIVTDRKNKRVKSDSETLAIVKDKISKLPEENSSTDALCKYDNPVIIEAGDTVKYKIEVYNNSTIDAKDVVIRDWLPTGASLEGVKERGTTDITWDEKTEDTGKKYYEYTLPNLGKGKSTYFDMYVKFNEYSDEILENRAWINDVKPGNKTDTYRIDDADYVEMKKYSVSLEKYVSKVTSPNGEATDYSERANKEEHADDATNTLNLDKVTPTVSNDYKYNNPVTVSNGDKVTYTIKVTNESDTVVKITKIADYLPNGVDGKTGDIYCTEFADEKGQTENKQEYTNVIYLNPNQTKEFKITVTVTEPDISVKLLKNVAEIISMENKNGCPVKDTTGKNNKDADYIQVDYKPEEEKTTYTVHKDWVGGTTPENVKVRLYKINEDGTEELIDGSARILSDDNDWTFTWKNLDKNFAYIAREISKNDKIVKDDVKYREDITTEYTPIDNGIIITNSPTTTEKDKISYTVVKIWDDDNNSNRPNSIKVRLFKNSKKVEDIELNNSNWSYTWTDLEKYDEKGNLIKYTVKELKKGYLGTNVVVEEGEEYNSYYKAYYLQEQDKTTITNKEDHGEDTDDLAISGIVWNDLALDKTQSDYNGVKDGQEEGLAGVKVMLNRVGKGIVATTYTNENGEYSFTNETLSSNLPANERFIKGPKVAGTNRWEGRYYSYKVEFEYDGVKYTNTVYNKNKDGDSLDSNAIEKNRIEFNKKFATIKNGGAYNENGDKTCDLTYDTTNESGYIPQSIYQYNPSMAIQASTATIELKNSQECEQKIKHVNLGLRGRDVFDLELTSDVYSTKVTVNNVDGAYNYNSNKVTVRRTDTTNYNYNEDAANPYLTASDYIGKGYNQGVRRRDITNSNYESTGLAIEVTYKITVTNASITKGIATKITNYFDTKYSFVKAYSGKNEMTVKNGKAIITSGTEHYNLVEIETPGTQLAQSEKMEIYVVYTLNNAATILNAVEELATYNMAEITEYKTFKTDNEATRGLIDKDSAPGSANIEEVRLHPDKIGDKTTVKYYFDRNDLSVLKYEDDTYATPTLIFVKDNTPRTITGIVFEDKTKINVDKVKSGNGIKDNDEVGVFGATVQLIELNSDGTEKATRDEVTTNENGFYTFRDFLPGNYIIRYHYGDTKETVLLNKASAGVNGKSYNGEDFQATNNSYSIDGIDTNKLDTTPPNYWYLNNEGKGVSTAKDDGNRRKEVSKAVSEYTTDQMKVLNDIRDNKTVEAGKVENIIKETKMHANTPSMIFEVEKVKKQADGIYKNTAFSEYNITNMNFGIAEVPVTTIDMQKEVSGFTIVDSTGQNEIASALKKADGNWELKGDVIPELNDKIDVSIEDEKLQGARLQVTYNISVDMNTEKNFDNTGSGSPTITCLVDFVNNNLSYNEDLGKNKDLWEVATYDGEKAIKKGVIDPEGKIYTTVLKATAANPLLNATATSGKQTAQITLEKVLSSTESTLDTIIESTVDMSEYFNIVEIMELDYTDTKIDTDGDGNPDTAMKDRIRTRTPSRYIIIPGKHYDSAISDIMVIHAPTGDNSINMTYYVIALIGLTVLAVGVFVIKKFVVKK